MLKAQGGAFVVQAGLLSYTHPPTPVVCAATLSAQLLELQACVEEGEAERERLRVQLARLKVQMIKEQEDEEEAVTWRLQQEVAGMQVGGAGVGGRVCGGPGWWLHGGVR